MLDKMRIAHHWRITLPEVEARFSPSERLLWKAYYAIRPWGLEIQYLAWVLAVLTKDHDLDKYMPDEYRRQINSYDFTEDELKANDRSLARQLDAIGKMVQSGQLGV